MKSFLIILLSMVLLAGCNQQRSKESLENEELESVDVVLKDALDNFEKRALQVYPERSERLILASKKLEARGPTPHELALLEQAAGADNPQKALFAGQILVDHRLAGEVIEKQSFLFLKSEDLELQWHGTWNLFRKQSRIGPLSPATIEGLALLLNQLLESERENRKAHIQLILKVLAESQNDSELAVKTIVSQFPEISAILETSGFESNAPIVRSVLIVLSRAPANLQQQALNHIAVIEAGEPEFFNEEIEAARAALRKEH